MRWFFFMLVTWTLICERECVNQQDIEECGSQHFVMVRCTSVNFFYRECQVKGAVQITAIKLHTKISKYACDFKDSFGYRLNNVWVTNGCSGEFYLCYNGASVTTTTKTTDTHIHTHDVITESPTRQTRDTTTSDNNVDVLRGSTATEETDVLIYVIVASCVVLLVGIGLIVGCVVKRRQQNDKSRHLAAKRQIRIELKEHREHMEENGVAMLPLTPGSFPMATRSLSVESINYGEPVNYNYGFKHDNEREGSIDSSRSSASGMTSASAMTTGHIYKSSPSWDGSNNTRQSFGILKKGLSTSDISMLGRMYCDANTMSGQSKSSLMRHSRSSLARCSQSSLESVREVCNKYQVFDIPLERKLEQQNRRHSQFNTVGFSFDQNAPNHRNVRNPKYNTLGHSRGISDTVSTNSPIQFKPVDRSSANIKTTQALVHRSPSIKSHTSQTISTISGNVSVSNEMKMGSLQHRQQKPVVSLDNVPRDASAKGDNLKPRDSHYHDPTSLKMQLKTPQVKHVTLSPARLLSPTVHLAKPEMIYRTVDKEKRIKPVILPKPSSTIYATVNKSYFKAASRADYTDYSYDIKTLEDDEEDLHTPEVRDNQYARLDAFRSESTMTHPVPVVRVPEISSGATNC